VRQFVPVDLEWQMLAAIRMGIPDNMMMSKLQNPYEEMKILDHTMPTYLRTQYPSIVADVLGDGNCLFRALSYAITGGSEDAHAIVRSRVGLNLIMTFYGSSKKFRSFNS
jgi:hypothetical protein